MNRQALAIVGMRRSGTSSMSLALHELGVSFGRESQLYRGDDYNREGYWEHRAMNGIHRRFRLSLNLQSLDFEPTPSDWRERPATEYLLDQGARCLKAHFLGIPGPWAWKDPDASLCMPFVYAASERAGVSPHVLVCVRNPIDVAASEMRRKGIPHIESYGSWLAYTLGAVCGSKSKSVILFSDFLQNPAGTLKAVLQVFPHEPSSEAWNRAVASVRTDLVHSLTKDLKGCPSLVQRVYSLCERASEGLTETLAREFQECYLEFESARMMFSRPRLEEVQLLVAFGEPPNPQSVSLKYRPEPGWQTLNIKVPAPAGSVLSLLLYPLPANIWIRKTQWLRNGKKESAVIEPGSAGNLQNQFGIHVVTVIAGPDQIRLRTPAGSGELELELEILVESNNLVSMDTFAFLSGRILNP
jgi:hypothetical protein